MQLLPTRIDLFKRLRPDAIGAEVGVWRGYNAVDILNNTRVGKLFLVDAWAGQTGVYDDNGVPKTVEEHEKDLAECKRHLRGHLPSGRVEIVRGMSVEVATHNRSIPPLDFVYLDADHNYEGVRYDLLAWEKRLKPDGVIMGHDFTENAFATRHNFGVIRAVNEFCETRGWEIVALTQEDFASYELHRGPNWTGAEL
jgi:hypothetical protein